MARRRFFVDRVRDGRAVVEGGSAEHLRKVLRAEPGQRFEVSDNRCVYLAEIEGFQKGVVRFRILEQIPAEEPEVRLTLLAALIKFDRFEWIVEKATELGVETIIPVAAARSEKGLELAAAKRLDRWRRIAAESSQQARRVRRPEILPCADLREALKSQGRLRLLLDEEPGGAPLLAAVEGVGPRTRSDVVRLLVGPEGGWTGEEREAALNAGWVRVSLGPLVLRAETAATAGLAVVQCAWQGCRM
ncbi:MAG: 16S rRNA (uracil(1498)-N(3))-methyltransferase [Bryobacteraceae bacterium]